jgi:LmbE family N-acetylglucosaminyl deacetylase
MNAAAGSRMLGALAGRHPIEAKCMIVVAHPDDETIGMGAQLCGFRDALLIQITDGAPRNGRDAAAHGYGSIAEYAFARRVELFAALAAGNTGGVRVEVIGIPDQQACLELVSLSRDIAKRVQAEAPEAIFSLPYEGGHPDHDAVAFAVWAGCRLAPSPPAVIELTSYHAEGDGVANGDFLPGDRQVSTLALKVAERSRKRRMIDCFVSQRDLLSKFGTEIERFREAPDYDFTHPPHSGELHYERLGWGITGEIWRRHSAAALDVLGLWASRWP